MRLCASTCGPRITVTTLGGTPRAAPSYHLKFRSGNCFCNASLREESGPECATYHFDPRTFVESSEEQRMRYYPREASPLWHLVGTQRSCRTGNPTGNEKTNSNSLSSLVPANGPALASGLSPADVAGKPHFCLIVPAGSRATPQCFDPRLGRPPVSRFPPVPGDEIAAGLTANAGASAWGAGRACQSINEPPVLAQREMEKGRSPLV
jgi:hypothetical protein